MEDRPRLSRLLYNVLGRVGASQRIRRLHHQNADTREIIETVYTSFTYNCLANIYICGSYYEGSVTPALASDQDIIFCQSYLHVAIDAAASPPGLSFLMVRDSWTYPGYVKLQLVWDQWPQYGHHVLLQELCYVDNIGRVCFKHFNVGNMHGPSQMQFDENGVHIVDRVPAFRCDNIPQYAQEWIMRPRPYEWPSRGQLQTMSRMGCMFVGVGHVHSGEKEIEWRTSYTLQERLLMSSLNPVQHKVYILLKMFKKSILENMFHEETLTSYHFKTCVLYAVQMSPARVWTKDNIINCLVFCLKLMLKWLETNYCPSYLIKDQDLFKKEVFSRLRTGLLKKMREIIQSGHQFLYMIQSDNVGDILRNGDWRMHREIAIREKNAYIFKLKRFCIRFISMHAIGILRFMGDGNYDPFTLMLVLENLKNARHINNHTEEVTQFSMACLFPWLHLHIANSLATFTYTCPDRAVRERVMKLVDSHLHESRGMDLVNGRLAVASVLYTFEKYEECSILLHLIESDFTYQVMMVCPCIYTYSEQYHDIREEHERNRKIARMSTRQYIKSMSACCVIFLPSAAAIAPEPLQYEMQRSLGTLPDSRVEDQDFWFDWAVVDAKVYLYFMQYLISSKLHTEVDREVAKDNLREEIALNDQRLLAGQGSWLGHLETAYNLLGWIYMQEERLAEAYVCFHYSWLIRPFHNAAKYHMRDFMIRLAERRV